MFQITFWPYPPIDVYTYVYPTSRSINVYMYKNQATVALINMRWG